MTQSSSTPGNVVDQMLSTAQRALERGDVIRARALLRMLSAQYPQERRVWEARADIAETDEERALVLEHMASLQPRRAADTVVLPETRAGEPAVDETVALPPTAEPRRRSVRAAPVVPIAADEPAGVSESARAARIRWPIYLITAVALAFLLLLALWRWAIVPRQDDTGDGGATIVATVVVEAPTEADTSAGAAPSVVPIVTLAPQDAAPTEVVATVAAPTAEPATVAVPTAMPTVVVSTATPLPTITTLPALAYGQVIEQGEWNVSLLRPEHAILLNGSIGSRQPSGQFALALLSIGYSGDTAVPIPADLLTLQDNQGRTYRPVPGASTDYLATFGRGQYGDVSLEEVIPANAGNVSVPVIFDVPLDARGLRLLVGNDPNGWEFAPPPAP